MKYWLPIFAFLLTIVKPLISQTEFSQDNAADLLHTLSIDIGPRPMGSPAEQRALHFAVQKFSEYGCDTAFVMKMDATSNANTTSGIAVGIKHGSTKRIIVIGGHIDSSGPEIPGANDDGSGTAVVLETARIFGKRETQSTLVFACFGGEEQGLRGSRHFVDHFDQIDSVALMLQVDMTNGLGDLELSPDIHQKSAPRWLVEASLEEFDRLGYTGMSYPTHFFSVNYVGEQGGAGSDHEPFLQKGIPAVDFTTDVSDPIHTPRDLMENFDVRGLKRSGDLVVKLIERFDGGVPSRDLDEYWLYLIGTTPVFIPFWGIWVLIVVAIVTGVVGLINVRRRRVIPDENNPRIGWSGLKIWFFALIMAFAGWYSSDLVGLLRGVRHPWWTQIGWYTVLGGVIALLALSLLLRLTTKFRITQCPYSLFKRSAIFLTIFLILLTWLYIKLGVEPGIALLLISLAIIVRQPYVKLLLVVVGMYWMLRLFFHEETGIIYHSIVLGSMGTKTLAFLNPVVAVVLSLLILPFLLSFAAIVRDAPQLYRLVALLRSTKALALEGILVVGLITYLLSAPVYDNEWYRAVRIEQEYNLDEHKSSAFLNGTDYLNGLVVRHNGKDTTFSGRQATSAVPVGEGFDTSWVRIERTSNVDSSKENVNVRTELMITSAFRPYVVTVNYNGGSERMQSFASPWRFTSGRDNHEMKWYSFPDTVLKIPVSFFVKKGDTLTERIEVTFDSLAYPMEVGNYEMAYFLRRTKFVSKHVYGK